MVEIKIYIDSVNRILDIVQSAKDMGLTQGTDFDFAYHPCYELVEQKHVVFRLYDEKLSTIFSLKWS